jgi:hypothetical protein
MGIGSKFEEQWEGYCKMCEWFMVCRETRVCPYFMMQDYEDFVADEVVSDQNMRQLEYLKIMAEFGGEC